MDEALPQMGDILQEQLLVPQRHVVEQHEMLVNLAHVAHMRDDLGLPNLRASRLTVMKLADARHPDGVHLNEFRSAPACRKFLNNTRLGTCSPERDRHRRDGAGKRLVREHVVRDASAPRSRTATSAPAPGRCEIACGQRPLLVASSISRTSGPTASRTRCARRTSRASSGAAYLQLHRRKARLHRAPGVLPDLLVAVLKPADGGVIARIAAPKHVRRVPAALAWCSRRCASASSAVSTSSR